jgi:hypothetical protein
MAMVGGDERMVEAHDRAVATTLGWIDKNVIETRRRPEDGGYLLQARHFQEP